MPLSQERIGEIALVVLQSKLEEDGTIVLRPKEVKRDVANQASKFGITKQEAACFASILIKEAYRKTMLELEELQRSAPSSSTQQ